MEEQWEIGLWVLPRVLGSIILFTTLTIVKLTERSTRDKMFIKNEPRGLVFSAWFLSSSLITSLDTASIDSRPSSPFSWNFSMLMSMDWNPFNGSFPRSRRLGDTSLETNDLRNGNRRVLLVRPFNVMLISPGPDSNSGSCSEILVLVIYPVKSNPINTIKQLMQKFDIINKERTTRLNLIHI